MTNKDIIKMATNSDIQYYLRKIYDLESNMVHKTINEQHEAKQKIKEYTHEIKLILNEER